jgi:hypothetical protein
MRPAKLVGGRAPDSDPSAGEDKTFWYLEMPVQEYYSIQETSRITGMGTTQVYSCIDRGTLPGYLVGVTGQQTKKVKHDDLVAYIAKRMSGVQSGPIGAPAIVKIIPGRKQKVTTPSRKDTSSQVLEAIVANPEPLTEVPSGGLDLEALDLGEE